MPDAEDEGRHHEDTAPQPEDGGNNADGSEGRHPEMPSWFPDWVREDGNDSARDASEHPEDADRDAVDTPQERDASTDQHPSEAGERNIVDPPEWPDEWNRHIRSSGPPDDAENGQVREPPRWPEKWNNARRTAAPGSQQQTAGDEQVVQADSDEGPPLYWRAFTAVVNPILKATGFRRLADAPRKVFVEPEHAEPSVGPAAKTIRRVILYASAIIAFGVVMGLILWAYALTTPHVAPATEDADTWLMMAFDALQKDDPAAALQVHKKLNSQAPNSIAQHFVTGYLKGIDGTRETGASDKPAGKPQQITAPDKLVTWAGYYHGTARPRHATNMLEKAQRQVPAQHQIRLLRALLALATAHPRQAISLADEIETRIGVTPAACDVRGRAYLALDKPELAVREFQAELLAGGIPTRTHSYLADLYVKLGKTDHAITQLRAISRRQPDNAYAKVLLATLYIKQKRFQKAEKTYIKALEVDSKNIAALNNLAYVLSTGRNDPRAALKYARRAYHLAPKNPSVLDTLGWTYHLMDKDNRALPLLEKAVRMAPDSPTKRYHLAVVLRRQGDERDRRRAEHILRRLTENDENGEIPEKIKDELSVVQ